jgi:hypothetical protein
LYRAASSQFSLQKLQISSPTSMESRDLHAMSGRFISPPISSLSLPISRSRAICPFCETRADRRVRGEFKTWRDSFAATPRKADYAWTTLARSMSFAKDRGMITANPCEKGGRLYAADRTDKFWGETEIAALLAVASDEIPTPTASPGSLMAFGRRGQRPAPVPASPA